MRMSRSLLLEAKGPGYENFTTTDGEFQDWFVRGRQQLLDQARSQYRVAKGGLRGVV